MTVQPLRPCSIGGRPAIDKGAGRFGRGADVDIEIVQGTVTVGPDA